MHCSTFNRPHKLGKAKVVGWQENASKESKASKENRAQNLYTNTNLAVSIFFYQYTTKNDFYQVITLCYLGSYVNWRNIHLFRSRQQLNGRHGYHWKNMIPGRKNKGDSYFTSFIILFLFNGLNICNLLNVYIPL